MRSFLKIGLTLAIFLAAVVWVMGEFDSQKETAAYRLAREALRAEFLARAPWVWGIEDPAVYQQEVRGLFRWYADQVRSLGERFPSLVSPADAYLRELEARHREGRLGEPEFRGYKESYEQVAEVWEAITGGRYAPVMTGTSGSLRLDFFEARPTLIQGQRAIQGRFLLWGAQRSRVEEDVGGVEQTRIQTHASFDDVRVKLFDERERAIGELTFGLPAGTYVPVPEQRIEDFPPFAFVGDYAIPLVPHEAATMEMVAVVRSRASTGSEIRGEFVWKQPVPASWKLAEGERWEGARIGVREEP